MYREAQKNLFLAKAGWLDAKRTPLSGDASTRSYARLTLGAQSAILMDAPKSVESPPCPIDANIERRCELGWNARARLAAGRIEAFAGISEHLCKIGLSAPKIYATDCEAGLALIEDLGDGVYAREIEKGTDEVLLYEMATHALAKTHLAGLPTSVSHGGQDWPILEYDALAIQSGADLFSEWFGQLEDPSIPSMRIDKAFIAKFDALIGEMAEELAALDKVLLLRDYHAENLIWMPEYKDEKRVGILDFQDAVAGPAAWDMTMFLHDARRDVAPEVVKKSLKLYLDLTGHEETEFLRQLALAGSVNALRILGVFARLIIRDNKPRYRNFLTREWQHLIGNLAHPDMAELRTFIGEYTSNSELGA